MCAPDRLESPSTAASYTLAGDGVTTSFSVSHNLGRAAHIGQLSDNNGQWVLADVTFGANTDTVTVTPALANGISYTYTVAG